MADNGDQPALDYTEFDTSEGLDGSLDVTDDRNETTDADDSIQADDGDLDDPELEAIKARVKEMEEEAEKLKEMQNEVEKQMNLSSPALASPISMEDKIEVDARSIYVGQVDYQATAEELESHFHGCGSINRVTIQCDKFSGHPKGFAYIEFTEKDSVKTAEALDESLFRGRQIKVSAKRTNRPGISSTNRGRGRGRGRGSYRGGYGGYQGFTPRGRGRGGYRPRRASWYSPY